MFLSVFASYDISVSSNIYLKNLLQVYTLQLSIKICNLLRVCFILKYTSQINLRDTH